MSVCIFGTQELVEVACCALDQFSSEETTRVCAKALALYSKANADAFNRSYIFRPNPLESEPRLPVPEEEFYKLIKSTRPIAAGSSAYVRAMEVARLMTYNTVAQDGSDCLKDNPEATLYLLNLFSALAPDRDAVSQIRASKGDRHA